MLFGHIHKSNFSENKKIVYPGSLISLGFDELGEHGMVIGEFRDKYLKLDFKIIDDTEFVEIEVDISNMNSQTEIIDNLTSLYIDKNKFCKVILKGKRRFVINTKEIINWLDNPNILRVKDETSLGYNLEEISKENTLRGIFVKRLLDKKMKGFYSDKEIEKAIEIGLEAME